MTDAGPLILVVEDEPQMRRFIRASLGSHGYRVVEGASAAETASLVSSQNPSAILLDLGLPDGDGIELTRQLRDWCKVPIVVVSARGREEDKVAALDAGADDYLTKPFGVGELLARLRVALRHAEERRGDPMPARYEFGPLAIDVARREVTLAGNPVHLTPTEWSVLALLARHAGKVLTHRRIIEEIWGPAYVAQTHSLRVHLSELRKKVELDPARPRLLVNEPGVGYRLRDLPPDPGSPAPTPPPGSGPASPSR
jgi:two-component system KDP operon response regulator KdpE